MQKQQRSRSSVPTKLSRNLPHGLQLSFVKDSAPELQRHLREPMLGLPDQLHRQGAKQLQVNSRFTETPKAHAATCRSACMSWELHVSPTWRLIHGMGIRVPIIRHTTQCPKRIPSPVKSIGLFPAGGSA